MVPAGGPKVLAHEISVQGDDAALGYGEPNQMVKIFRHRKGEELPTRQTSHSFGMNSKLEQ
jgi:hypothetical protein